MLTAAMFLATGTAHATEDFCAEVTQTPDGFLALREGPGTQFKMIAKLKPGFPLDARTGWSEIGKRTEKPKPQWMRVMIANRISAYVYSKYTKPRDCPGDSETEDQTPKIPGLPPAEPEPR